MKLKNYFNQIIYFQFTIFAITLKINSNFYEQPKSHDVSFRKPILLEKSSHELPFQIAEGRTEATRGLKKHRRLVRRRILEIHQRELPRDEERNRSSFQESRDLRHQRGKAEEERGVLQQGRKAVEYQPGEVEVHFQRRGSDAVRVGRCRLQVSGHESDRGGRATHLRQIDSKR